MCFICLWEPTKFGAYTKLFVAIVALSILFGFLVSVIFGSSHLKMYSKQSYQSLYMIPD